MSKIRRFYCPQCGQQEAAMTTEPDESLDFYVDDHSHSMQVVDVKQFACRASGCGFIFFAEGYPEERCIRCNTALPSTVDGEEWEEYYCPSCLEAADKEGSVKL